MPRLSNTADIQFKMYVISEDLAWMFETLPKLMENIPLDAQVNMI